MTDPLVTMIFRSKRRAQELENVAKEGERISVYGSSLEAPILGKHTEIPRREKRKPIPIFDTSLPYVWHKNFDDCLYFYYYFRYQFTSFLIIRQRKL